MRRRGRGGRRSAEAGVLRFWYVEGFAVTYAGREVGTVELVLPTLDGTAPGSLVIRRPGGESAVVDVGAVAESTFGDRRLVVTVEPVFFDAAGLDGPNRTGDCWPASA